MLMDIYQNYKYNSQEKFIISSFIREYDLKSANISSLLYNNIITLEEFNKINNLPKQDREKYVGLMIRYNQNVYQFIQSGIIEAKKLFFENNKISLQDVLIINNDAIFIKNKICKNIEFPPFLFVEKNVYTSYFKLCDLEFFYRYDHFNNSHILDVNGINNNKLVYNITFLSLLAEIFYSIENSNISNTIKYFSDIYEKYITRSMDLEFYRELNAHGAFKINTTSSSFLTQSLNIDENIKQNIDINRNLSILIDLHQILSLIYFEEFNRKK